MAGSTRIVSAGAAAVLAGLILAAQAPQQPVFRTGASLVRVDVTVTDRRGDPVTSLAADDFEVQEDNIPKTVETFKLVSADGRQAEDDDTSLAIRSPEHAAAEAARDEVRVFLIFWDEYHIGQFEAPLETHWLSFLAEPGVLQLQTTVRDPQGQTIDEDTRQIAVPDLARTRLALSAPMVILARNASELRGLASDSNATPFAGREFGRTDRLFVRFTVYGESATHAIVSVRLLSRTGSALLPLAVTPPGAGLDRYQIDLPLASIARGDFLIAIAAVAGDDRAEALVPVRVVS